MFTFRKRSPRPGKTNVLIASTVDISNLFYDGIVQSLGERGKSVHVVSSAGAIGPRLFGGVAKLHTIEMQRGLAPIRDLCSLLQWIGLLVRVRPKLLVVGTPKAALLGTLAGRIARVPLIVYIAHGIRGERSTGGLGVLLSITEGLTIKCAHRVVAVSRSLSLELHKNQASARTKIVVLGHGSLNGVDLQRFAPPLPGVRFAARTHWGLPKGLIFGFVGRLERDKGGHFLIQLMDDPRIVQLDPHLLVIGDLENESLRGGIDKLVAAGRATVTGWVEKPEQQMAALDVLVHPTKREGLGMAILEAQAMGIPVLTNAVTGTIDALEDGVGGFFPEFDSIQSWVDHILCLAEDEEKRRFLGSEGRKYVSKRFDRAEVVGRFVDYLTNDVILSTPNNSGV